MSTGLQHPPDLGTSINCLAHTILYASSPHGQRRRGRYTLEEEPDAAIDQDEVVEAD